MPIKHQPSPTEADRFDSPIKTVFAVTSARGWIFFEEMVRALQDAGFDTILVSSPGERLDQLAQKAAVQPAVIPMSRDVATLSDLRSLWRLYQFMRRTRPTITHVGSPKAGLLGGLAARLSGVPCRIYTLHGLRLETTKGWKRMLLRWAERVACSCAHRVICVSPSVRRQAVDLKLVAAEKTVMMANGSFCGVDVQRYSPQVADTALRERLAERLGIPRRAPVIGFVGRLTRDKGVPELVTAFGQLRQTWPELRLLLVGEFEDGDPVPAGIRQQIEADPYIVAPGYVDDTAPYYGLMNAFVLPSYREGFPIVSLEAQACGVPVVTTTATGAIDSIVDGVTGFLVPTGNAPALAARIDQILRDPQLRSRMGQAGRELVVQKFRQEMLGQALLEEYLRLLRSSGKKLPDKSAEALAANRPGEPEVSCRIG